MCNLGRALVLLTILAVVTPPIACAQGEGKKYAVIVGVREYQHPKLPKLRFTENDASELADVLKPAGYDVILLTDSAGAKDSTKVPSKANIEKAVSETLRKCQKSDTIVIALAGHGLQFAGKPDSYFCPTEAKPFESETDTLVSVTRIYEELEKSFAGVKVLFVDACRDDPGAARGATRGIDADTAPRPPRGVAALFSCSAGEVAYEHERFHHGVFFHYVLEGLRKNARERSGEVNFDGLSKYVREQVAHEVPRLIGGGARQSPNLKADLSGASPVLVGFGASSASRPSLGCRFYDIPSTLAEKAGLKPACQPMIGFVTPGSAAERMGMQTGDVVLRISGKPMHHANDMTALFNQMKLGETVELVIWRDGKEQTFSGPLDTPYSESEGVRRCMLAAAEGNAEAMYTLALTLTATQPSECARLARMAAEKEHPAGMWKLGNVLEHGVGVSKDIPAAIEQYRKAADLGVALAQHQMGYLYLNGKGVPKDLDEAVKWYRKAADQNFPDAFTAMGYLYTEGKGVSKDLAEAANWYRKAAEQENSNGEYNLALILFQGKGVEKNPVEAMQWLQKAADRNYLPAMERVGECYAKGEGVTKDEAEAVRWFDRVANIGDANAQLRLAYRYRDGKGVPKSLTDAARWLQRAASQNNTEAQHRLGTWYLEGIGVAKDTSAGLALVKKAAEKDYVLAWVTLGTCYEQGIGVEKNALEAVAFYRKAADRGWTDAYFKLGMLYLNGTAVAKDDKEAAKWFRKGAEKNSTGCVQQLAHVYTSGKVTPEKSDPQAVAWFRAAIERGDLDTTSNLGVMYENGWGVNKDLNEAFNLYKKAADKGHKVAQTNVGLAYANGRGVQVDYNEAAQWYRKAADQKYPRAEFLLGTTYENGRGNPKNQQEAIKWYRVSAAHGHDEAVQALKRLNQSK
ncbi:MAG: caspase family protein [Gemmataceae bacterium]